MKRVFKKAISMVMAIVMVAGVFIPCLTLPSGALVDGKFEFKLNGANATITKYTGSTENLKIPSKLDGKKVTGIGIEAFLGCKSLKTVVIPDEVTTISDSAFGDCVNLKTVTLPKNLGKFFGTRELAENAFWGCKSLTSFKIHKDNEIFSIKDGALYNKKKTWLYIVPGGKSAFTIPDNVESVERRAFYGCSKLKSVYIPKNLFALFTNDILYLEFSGCTSLTEIKVHKDNKKFSSKDGVLFDKKQTTLIAFPAGKSASSYTIPKTVEIIAYKAFTSCVKLKEVKIPKSVEIIDAGSFLGCTSLQSVIIPDSVLSIKVNAFQDCVNLKSITIPNSVLNVGYAFNGCTKLKSVTFKAKNPPSISYDVFKECPALTTIYVPKGSKAAYGKVRALEKFTIVEK